MCLFSGDPPEWWTKRGTLNKDTIGIAFKAITILGSFYVVTPADLYRALDRLVFLFCDMLRESRKVHTFAGTSPITLADVTGWPIVW